MTDTKALRERLLEWAQNEEMVDQYLTAHGHDCIESADAIERLEAERDAAVAKVDVAEAGYRAAVSKAQWQASTNAELNRHLATVERYRAALAELVGILEIAAVMPEAIHKQMFVSWGDPALERARAALKGEG